MLLQISALLAVLVALSHAGSQKPTASQITKWHSIFENQDPRNWNYHKKHLDIMCQMVEEQEETSVHVAAVQNCCRKQEQIERVDCFKEMQRGHLTKNCAAYQVEEACCEKEPDESFQCIYRNPIVKHEFQADFTMKKPKDEIGLAIKNGMAEIIEAPEQIQSSSIEANKESASSSSEEEMGLKNAKSSSSSSSEEEKNTTTSSSSEEAVEGEQKSSSSSSSEETKGFKEGQRNGKSSSSSSSEEQKMMGEEGDELEKSKSSSSSSSEEGKTEKNRSEEQEMFEGEAEKSSSSSSSEEGESSESIPKWLMPEEEEKNECEIAFPETGVEQLEESVQEEVCDTEEPEAECGGKCCKIGAYFGKKKCKKGCPYLQCRRFFMQFYKGHKKCIKKPKICAYSFVRCCERQHFKDIYSGLEEFTF